MNSDNLPQMLQTGFHLTLGAASFLIETLQDPLKREENLEKLNSDLGLLADELLEKGEMSHQEARNFVETVFAHQSDGENNGENNDSEFASDKPSQQQWNAPADNISEPFAQPDVQLEIQELTELMAALRAELENLRAENSDPD